jgi:large subunit ribosomal protein L10
MAMHLMCSTHSHAFIRNNTSKPGPPSNSGNLYFPDDTMVKPICLLPLGFVAAAAFTGVPLVSRTPSSTSSLYMGGGTGYATSLDGKKEKVDRIKGLLDTSQMIFTVPAGSITVAQSQTLRRSMPEGTTVSVVKNTLMTRAIEGSDYEAAASMLKGANMWFFIEDDMGASIKAYNQFIKENGLKDSHGIFGGVMEGSVYDAAGVDAIGKLPSKNELYAQIAGSIKAVPTKVARVIKAPNSKLARAIKLATEKNAE